jgi:hypothetical protein
MDFVMAGFSATEAAFEGFRLTREHPRAVLAWMFAYFIFTLGLDLITITWAGPDLASLRALSQAASPDTNALLRTFAKLAPYVLFTVVVRVVFFAVLNCAIYRAVLRPYERGLAYFQLGADEFRMMGLYIVLFVLWLFAIFAVAFVGGVAAGTLGVSGGAAGAFIGFLVGAGAFCLAISVGVRLSLAAPMTFDQHRITVFRSWSFTRGSFWPLVGAYFMLLCLLVVILMLVSIIVFAVVTATGGSVDALARLEANSGSVGAFLTIPTLLSEALGAALVISYFILVLSPAAIAYQGLARPGTNTQVFA